jgi:hypothetical protein
VEKVSTAESKWGTTYKIGVAAAIIAVIVFWRNFGVELTTFNGFGVFSVPEVPLLRAIEWFALFRDDPLVGMM